MLAAAAALARRDVVLLKPVAAQPNWLGQWFIDHDRGAHMRSLDAVHTLVGSCLDIDRSEPLRLGPILTEAILASPHTSR